MYCFSSFKWGFSIYIKFYSSICQGHLLTNSTVNISSLPDMLPAPRHSTCQVLAIISLSMRSGGAAYDTNLPLRSDVLFSANLAITYPGPSGLLSLPSSKADTKPAWSASLMKPLPCSRSSFCMPVSVLPGLTEILTISFSSAAKCWASECKAALDDPYGPHAW